MASCQTTARKFQDFSLPIDTVAAMQQAELNFDDDQAAPDAGKMVSFVSLHHHDPNGQVYCGLTSLANQILVSFDPDTKQFADLAYQDREFCERYDVKIHRSFEADGHGDGFFLGATLFDHVTADMEIYRDEIFGPVLSVVRVDDFAAAIELINNNPWGNGTAVFTNDGGAARTFQSEIQVGMVGINLPIPVPLGFYSFGGWKQSIFGDYSIYGPESIGFYTRPKVMISRWGDPIHRGVDLGFRADGKR